MCSGQTAGLSLRLDARQVRLVPLAAEHRRLATIVACDNGFPGTSGRFRWRISVAASPGRRKFVRGARRELLAASSLKVPFTVADHHRWARPDVEQSVLAIEDCLAGAIGVPPASGQGVRSALSGGNFRQFTRSRARRPLAEGYRPQPPGTSALSSNAPQAVGTTAGGRRARQRRMILLPPSRQLASGRNIDAAQFSMALDSAGPHSRRLCARSASARRGIVERPLRGDTELSVHTPPSPRDALRPRHALPELHE